MKVGVYCTKPRIAISRPMGSGTSNEAECLAVIEALREATDHGLFGFVLFSDSQLVVNWVSGVYRCNSETNRNLVEEIRAELEVLEAKLKWCSGERNPADCLSRF
jgi:ribonuclease HI